MNPFHHRGPVTDPAHFFGRSREMEALLARATHASKPQCVSVVGLRRMGKSSLFRQLIDVRGPQSVGAGRKLVFAYESLEGAGSLTVDRFFQVLLRRVGRQVQRQDPDGRAPQPQASGVTPEEAFSDWIEELSEEGWCVVLALDEFDVVTMNPAFDAALFGRLRYLTGSFSLAWLTSSYASLADLCHREEIRQSPFFNVFTSLNLGLLSADEATELLTTLSERAGARFDAAELEFLRELGGTHPFHLQQAASALWEARQPAARERARAAFLEEAIPHFQHAVGHLDLAEKAALAQAAGGLVDAAPGSTAVSLERRGLLVSEAAGGGTTGGGAGVVPFSAEFGRWLQAELALRADETRTTESPAARATIPRIRHPAPGQVLAERWMLMGELGRGGFGIVFEAEDRVLGRSVAVKVLRADRLAGERGEGARERFLREARAAARVSHPNVVVVHDIREQEGDLFVIMELLPGRSLRDIIDEKGALGVVKGVELVTQAAEGVGAAHALGIVHRDLKPENLVLDGAGRVKVVDFGLAWLAGESRLTPDSVAVLTPRYCSPEQVRGVELRPSSDVFSLGCVLYETVTGRRAYDGSSMSEVLHRIVTGQQPALDAAPFSERPALASLVARCLDAEPARRPADAGALAVELRALAR